MVWPELIGVKRSLLNTDMQEKKNKRLVIILCVLLAATAAVYWYGRSDNQYTVDKNLFRNFDLKTVDQITLESKSGKVDLKFNGSRWKVNEQFDADANMIEVLFATLQQAEPKRPIANSLQDSTNNALVQNGVKVNLFTAGKPVYGFQAGGNLQKTQGIFKGEGDEQSYQVIIPGYRVYVSGIFELQEKDWRSKLVFAFSWQNFQQLDVSFPDKAQNNFNVVLDNQLFGVRGLPQTDTTKLNEFLDRISFLSVDEYLPTSPITDSLFASKPILQIKITDIASRTYSLQLFPFDKARNQFPGLINGSERAVFAVDKVRELFKPKPFFKP
jgi:hypothetical protein